MSREEFRKSALNYLVEIYRSHKDQDVESLSLFVEVLFDYVDTMQEEHIKNYHKEE